MKHCLVLLALISGTKCLNTVTLFNLLIHFSGIAAAGKLSLELGNRFYSLSLKTFPLNTLYDYFLLHLRKNSGN